jgi:acetyl esterase/lipase
MIAHHRASPLQWIAFAAALLLFLCSLLVVFSAPTTALWITAIVIAEWGHFAALVALFLAAISWRRGRLGAITALLALAAAVLCLLPSLRAAGIARTLPARCTSAFGEATNPQGRTAPFSLLDLFRGLPTGGVEVTEHVYAAEGKKQLKLSLYRAKENAGPQPIVIIVHGGGWYGGSKEQLPAVSRHLAREHYAVASINYRHAPRFPSPAAVEDVFRALEFLKTNAARWQLDATRIVLIGRSAGGQIALSAAYAGREPAIRGVVGFYSPSDLVRGYEVPSRRWVLDSRRVLRDYLGGSPNERPEAYAAASAINFVNAATPPTLLIHGQLDPIVWPHQSERLAARLQQAGRPELYLALPWATHGCEANLSGPSGQLSLYAVDRFLAAVFAASRGSERPQASP